MMMISNIKKLKNVKNQIIRKSKNSNNNHKKKVKSKHKKPIPNLQKTII
jgi:hypothetical protein